jgi:cobalamin biosynthesis protein CobT
MTGDKFTNASVASIMLTEVLSNQLHIPLDVTAFTASMQGMNKMLIIKEFSEPLLSRDQLITRHAVCLGHMASNLDGDAIMFSYDKLIRRKEKRKLLIVCSDGSPAGGAGSRGKGIVNYTKKVVSDIETKTPVNIVGIGIMDDNVKRFYKEHYIIKDSMELEHALLQVIEGKLK